MARTKALAICAEYSAAQLICAFLYLRLSMHAVGFVMQSARQDTVGRGQIEII